MIHPALLKEALHFVTKAVDVDHYRPTLRCVYFEFDGTNVTLTGCDGYRLHTTTVPCNDVFDPAVLDIRDVKTLMEGLTKTGKMVTVESVTPDLVFKQEYKGKTKTYVCHTIYGKYPDWRAVVTQVEKHQDKLIPMTFPTGLLELVSNAFQDNVVKVSIKDNHIKIEPQPNPTELAFTMTYVVDFSAWFGVIPSQLYDAEADNATFYIYDTEPILVTYKDNPTRKAVVMPCAIR